MISKGPKKAKKTSAPETSQQMGEQKNSPVPNGRGAKPRQKKKSPPLPFQKKKLQAGSSEERTSSVEENDQNPRATGPVSVRPDHLGMGYAELRFSHEGGDYDTTPSSSASKAAGGSNDNDEDVLPHDVKTKFGYSTILFDEAKQKDIIAAERLKKEKGPPPPVPDRYRGGGVDKAKKLRQYLSDTSANSLQPREHKYQGKARPISAGSKRPVSAHNGESSSKGDYEEVGFENDEEEYDNVPRSNGDRLPLNRQVVGNYENVNSESNDRGRTDGGADRANHPLPPLPNHHPTHQQSNPTAHQRPQQVVIRPGQQQAGSVGAKNHGYVNLNYPSNSTPPQPKPRYICVHKPLHMNTRNCAV